MTETINVALVFAKDGGVLCYNLPVPTVIPKRRFLPPATVARLPAKAFLPHSFGCTGVDDHGDIVDRIELDRVAAAGAFHFLHEDDFVTDDTGCLTCRAREA